MDQLDKRSVTTRSVAITFDDGFYNNLSCALPVLAYYNVPATIFIPTGYIERKELLWPETLASILALTDAAHVKIGHETLPIRTTEEKSSAYSAYTRYFKTFSAARIHAALITIGDELGISEDDVTNSPFYDYFRIMKWNELKEIANSPLITIASHSVNHYRLQNITEDEARFEISESKKILDDKITAIRYFAYPFGGYAQDFSEKHIELVRQAGYRAAVSTRNDMISPATDRYQLPRPNVYSMHTISDLNYTLTGGATLNSPSVKQLLKGILRGTSTMSTDS